MNLKELIQRIAAQREEDHPFPENIDAYLEDFVPNTLLKSETLQQAFGVSNYEMEQLYHEGYDHYQTDRYNESNTVFKWLVILNPFFAKYWMGLAASQLLLNQNEKALHGYAMASLLDHDNPWPHYHAYECYSNLNDKKEAKKALDLAYKYSSDQPEEHKDLKSEIESLKRGESLC